MAIRVYPATPSVAPRLASIHVSAFSSNRLMRAIYPTQAIWTAFECAVEEKLIADMLDERTSVVVAQSTDMEKDGGGEIVGFAVWCLACVEEKEDERSSGGKKTYTAPRWNLPEGTDWDILNAWRAAAAKVADSTIGDCRHYELSWIAVSPNHGRQGVGRMLLDWGLDTCNKQRVPAYLESTVEAAETFYAKVGFREKGRIQLVVKGELYEEVACVYEPSGMQDEDDARL
ncbi:acyl-CoA N-acyltransferase, partial [Bipolaris maydis]